MVGVAGKSKAYNTCRSRRIKCDLQRPECSQCLKSGRRCSGYRRETVFLNQSSTPTPRPSPNPPVEIVFSKPSQEAVNPRRKPKKPSTSGTSKSARLPLQLASRVSDQQIFGARFVDEFLHIYLPTSRNCPKVPLTWLQLVPNTATEGPALGCAMAAVAFSVVGRATDNHTLVMESARKYGQALGELQRALWNQRLMCLDETLAASGALLLYELLECTENNMQAWNSHAQGVTRLMEARGPDSWDSPLAQMIFKIMRHAVMIHDLQNRKLSVLSQPEWQSGPWKIHVKNPDQQLYDVGIDLTRIIARTNTTKFINDNATFALERAALIEACQNLDTRLENWFQQLNEDIPTPHYWPEFSRMDNTSDEFKVDLAFPVSFHFPNIYVAKLLNDYWAISIILHSTIKLLYQSLAGQTRENRPEHPADDQGAKARAILPPGCNVPFRKKVADPKLLKSFASNIAQSMEYFLSKDMGILGPQWALFGLRVALQTYHYGPPSKELRWLQAVHDKISDEKGLRYSRILASTTWQDAWSNQGR